MRATRGAAFGLVLGAMAWCGVSSANADATVVRTFDAPGWGAIHDMAADPGMDRVTVVGRYATSVQTYEISTGRLVKSVSGSGFLSVTVNPSTHRVYATQQYAGIKVLDSVTGEQLEEILPPDGGGAVHDVVADPRTNRLYMLRDRDESPASDDLQLLSLDASGMNPHANLGVVSTGLTGMPWSHMAINPVTGRLYVARGDAGQANHGGGTLAVFDAATLARVASVPLGSTKLSGIAVNRATNKVYVGLWSDGVAVVDGAANTLLRTVGTMGGFPACNSLTNRIYLADPSITVIDGSTDAVVGGLVITAVGGVHGIALDETTGQILIHTGDDRLHVVQDDARPRVCDGTIGPWSASTRFSPARFSHRVAVQNGFLYLIAGRSDPTASDPTGDLRDVQFAPILTDGGVGTWTAANALPRPREGHCAEVGNGFMYVMGGILRPEGVSTNQVLYARLNLDGTLGTWTVGTPMARPLQNFASAANNGFLYTLGGRQDWGGLFTDVMYARSNADGTLGPWTPTTPLTFGRKGHAATVYGGRVYVAGGESYSQIYDTVESAPFLADGRLGPWTACTRLPAPRAGLNLVAAEGFLFAIGGPNGSGASGVVHSAPIEADGSLGAWTAVSALPTPRGLPASAAFGGRLYVTGGNDGGVLKDDVLVSALHCVSSTGLSVPTEPIVREVDAGATSATVNFVVGVSGSTPAGATLTVRDATGDRVLFSGPASAGSVGLGPFVFPVGTSIVEVEITGAAGRLAFASFNVHVSDTTPPVLSGCEPKTIECTGPTTPISPDRLGISASDAVDPNPSVGLSPSELPLGTTTVTATARDASGNAATAAFAVLVVDTMPPVFTVTPTDVTRPCEGANGAAVAFDVRAGDLCGEVSIASRDETGRTVDPAGTVFAVGTHTVTCTATDSSGNAASVSFAVTIVDDDRPVLVCPGDITAPTDAGRATATVYFTVTATDACDTRVSITCTAPWGEVHSGDSFPLGLTTVTCTAQDHSGNETTGSFRILVVDREAPVITAPSTASLVTDCAGTLLGITPALLGVTANDNADPAPRLSCTPSSLHPGTTVVDCTATDAAGNVAHASVSVTVLRGPFHVQFLRPLDGAVDNLVKAGQTVPLKLRVSCDNVFDAGVTVTVDGVTQIDGTGTPVANATVEDSGLADDGGNAMRLSDGQYVFNLSTKGWASTPGARFRVRVRVQETGHVDTFSEVVLKNK